MVDVGGTNCPVRAMLSIAPLELEPRPPPEKLKTKRPDSPAASEMPDPVRSMFSSLSAPRPVAEPKTPVAEVVEVFSNVTLYAVCVVVVALPTF